MVTIGYYMSQRIKDFLLTWKPIHLCWWFRKHGLPIPKYFIGGAATPPSVTTNAATSLGSTTATFNGNVTSDGGATISERGFVYSSTDATPTIGEGGVTQRIVSGTTGTYSYNETTLTSGTHYYYQAYATNSKGTSYGGVQEFDTSAIAPTVTTQAVSSIGDNSATGNGTVTSEGGASVTERGVCWNTSGTPTTSDSKNNNGTGAGAYTVSMTSLSDETHYYVRAYAINSVGTGYGSEVEFDTLEQSPTTALNTPADSATGVSTTPTLNFTGTDPGGDTLEYQVQIATGSDFATETVQDSYTSGNDSAFQFGWSNYIAGQSFQASADGNLQEASFWLYPYVSPTGNAYIKIYSHSGTFGTSSVPNTLLATSDAKLASSISGSYPGIKTTFTFSGSEQIALTSGTNYFLVIDYTAGDATNHLGIGRDQTSPTASGNYAEFNGGSWAPDANKDAQFEVKTSGNIILDKVSETDTGFTAGHPFTSGVAKEFTVQAGDTLDESTTYYWRVRAIDPSGSNTYGDWATYRSFTTSEPAPVPSDPVLEGVGILQVKDDHNDNSLSSAVWTLPAWGGAQVAENNNCLEITSTTASGYYGIDTPYSFNLTGLLTATQLKGPTTSTLTSFELYPVLVNADETGNNQLMWICSPQGGWIRAFKKVASSSSQVGDDLTYSTYVTGEPSNRFYLGIAELNGTTYWVYSLGGRQWRVHHSESNPLTITTVKVGYMEGTWQAEGSTAVAQFDNLNYFLRRIL